MPPEAVLQTLCRLWSLIEASGTPVAVAGGIALSYWGNPRSTQVVDLVVLSDDSETIAQLLHDAGFSPKDKKPASLGLFTLTQFSYEPEDHFVAVDVDLMCSTSKYYETVLGRAKSVSIAGISTPIAVLTREDLSLHKIYAGRLIDQADVMNLMEMLWTELDKLYLDKWARKLDLVPAFEKAVDQYQSSRDA
jgi:hypothetical protein